MVSKRSGLLSAELVTLTASDGLELDGLWVPGLPETRGCVIHVHGKGGNFYTNYFLRRLYGRYQQMGIGVLGLNTRGAGSLVEAYRRGEVVYVGSAAEIFEESLLDIDAGVEFVTSVHPSVALQGHSHGCDKVFLYSARRAPRLPLILLSPADSAALHRRFLDGGTFKSQITDLRNHRDTPWSMAEEHHYGVRLSAEQGYLIPVQQAALADWLAQGIHLFDGSKEAQLLSMASSLVVLGSADALQTPTAEVFAEVLRKRLPNSEVRILPKASHHFDGLEDQVAGLVGDWLTAQLDDA